MLPPQRRVNQVIQVPHAAGLANQMQRAHSPMRSARRSVDTKRTMMSYHRGQLLVLSSAPRRSLQLSSVYLLFYHVRNGRDTLQHRHGNPNNVSNTRNEAFYLGERFGHRAQNRFKFSNVYI